MLNIGNKKLKDANIGTTPLDSIYLGSTLIWRKEYVQWYDPEFKRVILEKYNNGKEMTQDQLNKFRSMYKLSESDIILDYDLFSNNKKLLSIKDLEKFVNCYYISHRMFEGCDNLGSTNLESTKDIDDRILEIPSNITDINMNNFNNTKYTGIKFTSEIENLGDGSLDNSGFYDGVFSHMDNLSGILDLTKVNYINIYQEFNTLGSNGNGLEIIYPYNANRPIFAGWFKYCNIKSFAPSKEQLESNKIKLPQGITEITPGAFSENTLNNFSVYIPNSVTKISGLFSQWNNYGNTYIKLLDIGSGCKYIQGDSGISNNNNYIIICRATTPPLLTLGGPNYKGINYTFDSNMSKTFPFNCDVKQIYVPDESVDLYKNDTKYGIQEQYSDEITEHTGTVECYSNYELKERNISWSRFKDVIKPLSEYVES